MVFRGRTRRKEYWLFSLIHILIIIGITLLDYIVGNFNFVYIRRRDQRFIVERWRLFLFSSNL
ncbi:DUF805 domain-containing protein [Paenibacillus agricola]|uniref:DUF805 domain-containing protein n=1 Tax=Paenibacillus agricola TaxID=2716264 RepID=A0ABX0J2F5_9BACL|nr:DUF805 domain-containing protein [Paenibacillus agricola]